MTELSGYEGLLFVGQKDGQVGEEIRQDTLRALIPVYPAAFKAIATAACLEIIERDP